MKNIPMFTTENGVATLVLAEIPSRKTAYIKIQDLSKPDGFLEECISFCRAAGAEKIYGWGHPVLETFPRHTEIWTMAAHQASIPETDAALFPVTEKTAEHWCSIYNEKMAKVPNSVTMTADYAKTAFRDGEAYFVHRSGVLLGIGMTSGGKIHAVASLRPGAGAEIVSALASSLQTELVELEVASANRKAVELYERLGFCKTRVISVWYQLL